METVTWWEFRGRPQRDRPEDVTRFRVRLMEALRAAHGLDADLRLRFATGPGARLFLGGAGASARRWFTRVLRPVYDPSQWIPRMDVPELTELAPRWVGHPRHPWPTSLRPMDDAVTACRVLRAALGSLPEGAALEFVLDPAVATAPPPPESVPPNSVLSNRRREMAAPSAWSETRRLAPPNLAFPVWNVRATLYIAPESRLPERGRGIDRLVERALTATNGNGWVFSAPCRWSFGRAGPFPVGEADLVAMFPPHDTGGTFADSPVPPPPTRLVVGWSPDGRRVGPALEPAQGRHLAILGETGMGKSSLLVAMAHWAAREHGLVLVDPMGDTAHRFLDGLPRHFGDRLTVVAPLDAPLGLNALEGIGVEDPTDPSGSERRLGDLVNALRRVRAGRYADATFWGPRIEEMVGRAIEAAAAIPSGTFVEAHELLEHDERPAGSGIRRVLPQLEALRRRVRERPEEVDGARRLLHELVRSPVLVRLLCARSSDWRPRDLVQPGRVVVVSGDAARVGESTARYLTAIYLALLWSELIARPQPAKTFVFLDEVQWFAHESLAEMLRLGRRFNVHVMMATQSTASLPPPVREATWTNVADVIAFRGSPEEAREIARIGRVVEADALWSLPRGYALAFLGKGEHVERIRTLVPPQSRSGQAPSPPGIPRTESPDASPSGAPEMPSTVPPRTSQAADTRAVLATLRAAVAASGGAPEIVVDLEELRARPLSAEAVRRVGARLGRSGALVPSRGGARPGRWRLGRDALLRVLAEEEPDSSPPESGDSPAERSGAREAF